MRAESPHPVTTIHWYATPSYPCSYLPNRQARSQVAVVPARHTLAIYDALIQQGFRRSGLHVYRPACDDCQACISTRIPAAQFMPSRSQRRAARLLDNVTIAFLPLRFQADHCDLYQRYQSHRHAEVEVGVEGDKENAGDSYASFLMRSQVDTRLLEIRDHHGQLLAVSVVDCVADGLSAVYTFFEPLAKGSLGTACVMWLLAHAKTLGLPYVYLGYWIADSLKMAYKAHFQPLQRLTQGQWVT